MSTQQTSLSDAIALNGAPRTRRTVRLDPGGLDHITERARRADVDVSHMIRRMLAYAEWHMPDGWVPPADKQHGRRPVTSSA